MFVTFIRIFTDIPAICVARRLNLSQPGSASHCKLSESNFDRWTVKESIAMQNPQIRESRQLIIRYPCGENQRCILPAMIWVSIC